MKIKKVVSLIALAISQFVVVTLSRADTLASETEAIAFKIGKTFGIPGTVDNWKSAGDELCRWQDEKKLAIDKIEAVYAREATDKASIIVVTGFKVFYQKNVSQPTQIRQLIIPLDQPYQIDKKLNLGKALQFVENGYMEWLASVQKHNPIRPLVHAPIIDRDSRLLAMWTLSVVGEGGSARK
ncbi:MAG TPA: hypothetical protein VHE10_01555 [Candidatus Paceibacterota bacterium]|nr:hypothetical protein [Candidatus Paceibacterota bacterium]